MAAPTLNERRAEYLKFWSTMMVKPERVTSVDRAARTIIGNRARYERVSAKTGVPWYMIGAIHWREASGNFGCVLHNGEKIIGTGRKTKLVPAGRGPFTSWEEAAIDALTMPPHALHKVTEWSLERILYETEKYNGWGYWNRGDHSSAYLWAGTNIDKGGKYVADHVWSATAQDQQNGAAPVMERILEMTQEVPAAKPAPAATASIDPQRQVGGLLSFLYGAIQALLKRKA